MYIFSWGEGVRGVGLSDTRKFRCFSMSKWEVVFALHGHGYEIWIQTCIQIFDLAGGKKEIWEYIKIMFE